MHIQVRLLGQVETVLLWIQIVACTWTLPSWIIGLIAWVQALGSIAKGATLYCFGACWVLPGAQWRFISQSYRRWCLLRNYKIMFRDLNRLRIVLGVIISRLQCGLADLLSQIWRWLVNQRHGGQELGFTLLRFVHISRFGGISRIFFPLFTWWIVQSWLELFHHLWSGWKFNYNVFVVPIKLIFCYQVIFCQKNFII